eukprot:1253603-Prorocentrum_lima.AAC.1
MVDRVARADLTGDPGGNSPPASSRRHASAAVPLLPIRGHPAPGGGALSEPHRKLLHPEIHPGGHIINAAASSLT